MLAEIESFVNWVRRRGCAPLFRICRWHAMPPGGD